MVLEYLQFLLYLSKKKHVHNITFLLAFTETFVDIQNKCDQMKHFVRAKKNIIIFMLMNVSIIVFHAYLVKFLGCLQLNEPTYLFVVGYYLYIKNKSY